MQLKINKVIGHASVSELNIFLNDNPLTPLLVTSLVVIAGECRKVTRKIAGYNVNNLHRVRHYII